METEAIEQPETQPATPPRVSGAKRRKAWMDDKRVQNKQGVWCLIVPEQGPRVGRGKVR